MADTTKDLINSDFVLNCVSDQKNTTEESHTEVENLKLTIKAMEEETNSLKQNVSKQNT